MECPGEPWVGTTTGGGTAPAGWTFMRFFICSMSAAQGSTLEESLSLRAAWLLFAGTHTRHDVPDLFCAGASVLSAVWKDGSLVGGSNWASRANLTDRGIMLQFMQASSARASCRWISTARRNRKEFLPVIRFLFFWYCTWREPA